MAMKRNDVYGVSDDIETTPNEVYGISTVNAGIQGNRQRQPVQCQTTDELSGPSPIHAYEDINNL